MLGTTEIIVITLAIVFLFGGNKVMDWVKKYKEAKEEINGNIK